MKIGQSLWRTKSLSGILEESRHENTSGNALKRSLSVRDLTAFGIAAIVGAGIFSTIGNAAVNGGPAISVLFVFTAIACGFSALCYAEFASMVPVAGSAYTYAYFSLGELIAWIIGWDLLLEYAIGNIACAISWSDYFTEFIRGFGWKFPEYLTMDYFSAMRAHKVVSEAMAAGADFSMIPETTRAAHEAWIQAPGIGGVRIIADLPALFIVVVITAIVFVGIRESRTINNLMVGLKLLVIFGVIVAGSFYVHPGNWSPFAPEGIAGVLKGVSAVFFAFIGFDAISTTAEECKNPSRDLPRAIFYSLAICTVLYVLIALVLTGMVDYGELGVGDPLAFVFKKVGLDWMSGIVAFTALIAMASVLLIFQLGQPRIWMSMSRDGLLPKAFSRIHPRFKTPSFATIVTGIVVAVPALFMNLTEVTDLTSIGTLFAFVVVCGGVLVLQQKKTRVEGRFQVPYINGKYLVPLLMLVTVYLNIRYNHNYWRDFLSMTEDKKWMVAFAERLPMWLFILTSMVITWLSYKRKLSLIPVMGLLSCLFLMTKLGHTNWMRFLVWLGIGLLFYFTFSRKNSKLNKAGVKIHGTPEL
ncbi:MAG: amino acid permease [Bacteroidales bacterium]|nr:amino acid permease [Bacteroidales bacterium]